MNLISINSYYEPIKYGFSLKKNAIKAVNRYIYMYNFYHISYLIG